MKVDHTDRIYKTIDARIGHNKFMRILSKIDKYDNVTVEFYNYHKEDVDKKDGTIKNKKDAYITEPISIDKFNDMIDKFSLIYPGFEIIGITDHSNMSLKGAIEKIKLEGYGKIIHYDQDNKK
jgi:hypothetical protein